MTRNNPFIAKSYSIAIVLMLLFFSSQRLYPQATHQLNITLKLKVVEGDLKNSMITITKKGAPYKVIDPNKESLDIELPLGFEYVFTFWKMGYITKSVSVDTHIPEGREESEFAKKNVEVELEKQPEDRIITYIQPVAKLAYSNQREDFAFDKDYAAQADKMMKKERTSSGTKTKSKPPAIVKSNPAPVEVKQPEYQSEKPKQKPIVKNKEVKVIQTDYRKITIITVNADGISYVYRKEEYSFSTFYYKDGKSITSDTFDNETR